MTRLLITVSVLLTILTAPAWSANDSSVTTESLRELISDDGAEYTLIQPGSEESNDIYKQQRNLQYDISKKIHEFLLGINRWIDNRLSGLPKIGASNRLKNINWLVALFVVAILAYFFASVIPAFRRGKTNLMIETDHDKIISLSMTAALQRSDLQARANNFHLACKELLIGFLMGLDEIDKIPYRISRTNREYKRIIRHKAPEHFSFAQRFLPFMDGVLYAGNTTNEIEYLEFRNILKQNFHR